MITNALAVHDLKFELDGNVTTEGHTAFSTGTSDWESFFDASGNKLALPAGFTASGFDKDFANSGTTFVTSDETTYATGSKDTLPITPGWQCSFANNVLGKDDIMNAYAAAYTANGEQFLYFALERNANTGDGNVGFWFLQNNVGCKSAKGNTPFTGDHSDGDLLVVSEFTKGGGVSTIQVFRWNGGATGSLGTKPVAEGADCTKQLAEDKVCATTNGSEPPGINGPITTPWLTANKTEGVGHTLQASEFFEGGLNLTKTELGNRCFNVFIGDTRSSQSLTATLFDFAPGVIGQCKSETVTTPVESDGTTPIPSGGLTIPTSGTLNVKDKALVKVSGVSSFNGTVTFHLCGPFEASSATLCKTGGVPIGEAQPVTSTPTTVTSEAATVTEVGRYCWRADFSGDSIKGVPGSSDSSATECFLVKPVTPTLTTKAGRPSPVVFGNPVTDTATLTGTANEHGSTGPEGSTDGSINPTTPGGKAQGKITFTLYKENCKEQATGTGTNPQTVNVSGDSPPDYGPVSFTPDAPGTYHWVATYSGDLPNTTASSAEANDATCGKDANEDVTVEQVPTTTTTRQFVFPQDKAKIGASSGGNLAGSVTFRLFDTLAHCQADSGLAGASGLLYSEPGTSHAVSGASPQYATTSNTIFRMTSGTATPVYWNVVYTSTNKAQLGSSSSCSESTSVTFAGDDTGIRIP
jgi:hypothetical protein